MANEILVTTEDKMKKSVEALRRELASIRTGRASPLLIEHVKVDYAGVPTPLNQVARISAPEVRLLVVQPWDKGVISNVEKAILKSELGLTPVNDGNVIRLNIPPLTEERRRELTKTVRKRIEERKIVLRNLRHDSVEQLRGLEKNKEISQDELKRLLNQLQKITDNFIADAEQAGRDKEKELLEG